MIGLTFDTGALIALERRDARMGKVLAVAAREYRRITVPTPVLGEWWRGSSRRREEILACVDIEPLDEHLAKLAGEALASVPRATLVDALVVASAARRGDVIYTSDEDDLVRLRTFFRGVRILRV